MSVYQESRCTADYSRALSGHYIDIDLQAMVYDFASEFNIQDRNIIRKISKQYRIIQIYQEEDIYFDNEHHRFITQRKPYIIKYENWNVNNRELNSIYHRPFEWEFNLNY